MSSMLWSDREDTKGRLILSRRRRSEALRSCAHRKSQKGSIEAGHAKPAASTSWCDLLYKKVEMASKIKVDNPVVEMDGDEMTRYAS